MLRYTVFITSDARRDLDEIAAWISRDSPEYADRVQSRIVDAIGTLAVMPNRFSFSRESLAGDPRAEGLRQLVLDTYRIIFEVRNQSVIVFAVVHGHRDKWEGPTQL